MHAGHESLHLPDVVRLEQLGKVVVRLLGLHLFDLLVDGIVVGRSLDIADHTQSYRPFHLGQLELERVVLTVSIMYEKVFLRDAVFANLDHFDAESLLHESVFVVLTEDHRLSLLQVNGIFGTAFFRVDGIVRAVIEDDTVLQNLAHGSALVVIGCLEDLDCAGGIGRNGTGKEVSTGAEAEFGRAERVFNSTVRT